ncbi:MAG: hypothetical protein IPH09_11320 [bacterium]|nr:hypothetical protein [bacterium]
MFTRVLQGNINLTRTPFPRGMSGQRLEILARQPLMLDGANYGHGTGHGVGHYLGVHEGPMGLTPRDVKNGRCCRASCCRSSPATTRRASSASASRTSASWSATRSCRPPTRNGCAGGRSRCARSIAA